MTRPKIAISACLLGEKVRFDGQGKRAPWLRNHLSEHVDWVPLCPEVGIGLSVPRDTLRLVSSSDGPRLITTRTGEDHTGAMKSWAAVKLDELSIEDVDGFLLTSKSPSCGLSRVRLYDQNNVPSTSQEGLFAAALKKRFPNLPAGESGQLNDPRLRQAFVERVFAVARLRSFFASDWSWGEFVTFHASEKMLLMAHSPQKQKQLGSIVARGRKSRRQLVAQRYRQLFLEALAEPVSIGRHVNALQHLAGFCKDRLGAGAKRVLNDTIEGFRAGRLPLSVPLALLESHGNLYDEPWMLNQTYLVPHTRALGLRNWTSA